MLPEHEAPLRALFDRYVTLTNEEWADLAARWQVVHYDRNEYLTEEGQIERYFYLVLEGVQRLYYSHDGNEVVLGFSFDHSPSGVFDSYIYQRPSQVYLQAITPSKLLGIRYTDLQELFDRYKNMERWGRLFMTEALIGRMQRELQLTTMSAEERYLRLLSQSPRCVELIPGKHLASYLNMQPETFSRMRKRLVSS